MSRKTFLRLLSAAVIVLSAAPAMALNPQPLPPSMRAGHMMGNFNGSWRTENRTFIRVPHCHAVQVGDPRKQPPMQVCS
ncbi:MAG TPA: hypothetical protein VFB45_10020 [Pseudolabrys sp.]|nr:hypothetical protein [Pseudolabrys sp.]